MERKNKKQTIEVSCHFCGKLFIKEMREYKRRLKVGGEFFYCNSECFNQLERTDELSPFRSFVYMSKKNGKKKHLEFNLDVNYLKEIWESQRGICPYSNLPMKLARTEKERDYSPESASLDRIDSTKGYVVGNVEFVCLSINYAKHNFDKQDFVNFLSKLKSF